MARTFENQTSAFGSFLDPLADKLLISVLFVTLTMVHLIPCMYTPITPSQWSILYLVCIHPLHPHNGPSYTLYVYTHYTLTMVHLIPCITPSQWSILYLVCIRPLHPHNGPPYTGVCIHPLHPHNGQPYTLYVYTHYTLTMVNLIPCMYTPITPSQWATSCLVCIH